MYHISEHVEVEVGEEQNLGEYTTQLPDSQSHFLFNH